MKTYFFLALACLIAFAIAGMIYLEMTQQISPEQWPRRAEIERDQMTMLIYVNTSKQVGDPDHLKVFANADAAETCFEENDPEDVAFEYEVLE